MTSRTIYLHGTAFNAAVGAFLLVALGYAFGDDATTIRHDAFWYFCGMLNAYLIAQKR